MQNNQERPEVPLPKGGKDGMPCAGEPSKGGVPLYDEPYRNQFHFSPAIGWMNDINGAWYRDGVYHLTYQADEAHLAPGNVGWGHAVSRDMVHWKQLPMALEPGRNTVGAAYSGSVVLDTADTAGFGAGIPILIYTDSAVGQCMNYWSERENRFVPYAGNPIVAMDEEGRQDGLEPGAQRDPKVFWDETGGQWIMMVYRERGRVHPQCLQVYRSPDLKRWERLEDFVCDGYRECPNIFPLRLDGGERKWVLQAASGRYSFVRFDGERFTVEQDWRESLLGGRDAYAGQTFVGLPEERIVYLCWLDDWSGCTVETSPWRNAASLPYELSLRTLPDGRWHVFAEPVAELEALRETSVRLPGRLLAAGENPFSALRGELADGSLTLDLRQSEARELALNLRGKRLTVDLEARELRTVTAVTDPNSWGNGDYRMPIPVRDGRLTLRFLADRDSLELLWGGGETLYLEEYGFDPAAAEWSVTADAPVRMLGAEYHTLRSQWRKENTEGSGCHHAD